MGSRGSTTRESPRAIRDLERATGHRLMEVNQSATEMLLKGTVAEGLADWGNGRQQPVR